jgi:hypothetical protein
VTLIVVLEVDRIRLAMVVDSGRRDRWLILIGDVRGVVKGVEDRRDVIKTIEEVVTVPLK